MSADIYKDPSLPVHERVADLLSKMTVEEKVGQMMQLPANQPGMTEQLETRFIGSYLHCTGNQAEELQQRAEGMRLGIPLIFGIDAIHGHCFNNDGTVFPTQLALSCTWNRELVRETGRITAREVRAAGIHWTFSPVLCIGRDPRWGRIDETFGEDPWLIGELASEIIQGYQGDDFAGGESILACAKHYLAYGESTGGRDSFESEVSRRKILSLFLPPFTKAVTRAGAATLMAGYQACDGVPCSANSWLLREIPRKVWKTDAMIVTDWNNVISLHLKQKTAKDLREASKSALLAGNDISMFTPGFFDEAVSLVKTGEVPMAVLDEAVARILGWKFKLGLFDTMRYTPRELFARAYGDKTRYDASLKASRESLVLLGNNGILPLDRKKIDRILLTGPNADDIFAQLGDWSFSSMQASNKNDNFHRDVTVTLREALEKEAGVSGFSVDWVKGADTVDSAFDEIDRAVEAAQKSDVVVACIGDTIILHGEGHDRADLDLTGRQQALLEALKKTGKPLVVIFMASKPLTIGWVKKNADAVVCAFNPGPSGGPALTELLFGDLNPSGRLTISFPWHVGQIPVYYNRFTGWHSVDDPAMNGAERYIDMPEEPLYAFGEGTGYTTFACRNPRITNPRLKKGEALVVSAEVANTGNRNGAAIVQLYINDCYSSVTTPIKELKAFDRIPLKAGESREITLTIPFDELSLVNSELERVVEPGDFEAMIGFSSRKDDLTVLPFSVS
jgi:beta-glucosidase